VATLVTAGHDVLVEAGSGEPAFYPDAGYADAGARLVAESSSALTTCDVWVAVRPRDQEVRVVRDGAVVIGLLQSGISAPALASLAARGGAALALERVPRLTRAQSMDVLSSQSTIAGYKAVLLGAASLGKMLPLLTTAAGTLAPAHVFILGAGVAGLQAIATAHRLGAVVSAFDVRSAAREHVESLGATFVVADLAVTGTEAAGGYARALDDDERQREMAAIARHLPQVDLVITTAQVPGQAAPILVTGEMLRLMRPGSVLVDLAAETGGNCALTRPGQTVVVGEVTVLGPLQVPSSVPQHASQLFSRNVLSVLQYLCPNAERRLDLDPREEVVGPMLITGAGGATHTEQAEGVA
jgi:NAD(P) transhydrogenase subunit alpha